MATTAIWGIKGRLDKVVNYVKNAEKTDAENIADFKSLQDVMEYATKPTKTEKRLFVTGVNCIPDIARDQMTATKRQYGKMDSFLAFHGYQSFAPNEVTPDLAHKIGVQLAEELWGKRFEVIVATHLDKNHLHNHFLINSVSFFDGKRYYDNNESYALLRKTSDRLCKENELSVILNPQKKGLHYAEWKANNEGKPTIRSMIQSEVDAVIRDSFTFKSFIDLLEKRGYTVKYGENVKYIAIKPPNSPKFIRLKSLGEDYTEEAIKQRLQNIRSGLPGKPITLSAPPKRYKAVKGTFQNRKPKKLKGFIALYFHYMYLLGKIKKGKPPNKKAAFLLRTEVLKFERYQKQFKFLRTNNIETTSQLNIKKSETEGVINDLIENRKNLYSERNGADEEAKTEIKEQISQINGQLKGLRKTLALCKNIEADAVQIEEKFSNSQTSAKKQNVKEGKTYEHKR